MVSKPNNEATDEWEEEWPEDGESGVPVLPKTFFPYQVSLVHFCQACIRFLRAFKPLVIYMFCLGQDKSECKPIVIDLTSPSPKKGKKTNPKR